MLRRNEEGFTLVELLIVVAIIAILAAIAIPQFTKYRKRAWVTEVHSDIKNAYTAAQAYLNDNPSGTVDSAAKLLVGGYSPSQNVRIGTSDMTVSAGSITLESTAGLTTQNAIISFNGRRTQSAAE
ncbi:MAG: prepilin-type N-terminal cleavage/methylation domain-containing protein [Deltaproteobacteria bacterium]|nr:prepilin-type N-terminal cleavage/methylation domain-containing protein [Deltaproteobacteria bacterium]